MTATAVAAGLTNLTRGRGLADPEWLARARESAFAWLARHGFPTRKDEDWKYLRLAPILDAPFTPARSDQVHGLTPTILDTLAPDLGGPRIVFVNGHLAETLSTFSAQERGVTIAGVGSMLATDPERLEPFFTTPDHTNTDGFAALNIGLVEDGAYIHIPEKVAIEQPIHLVFCTTTSVEGPVVSSPRSIVVAEANSRATIVETHVGLGDAISCTNAIARISLAPGAHVNHYMVQNAPDTVFHFDVLDVVQAADSRFSSQAFVLGAAVARHEVRVHLDGEDAGVTLSGLYQPAGDQYHDNPILIEHAAPNCTSRQQYNGVLDDRAHGVFNGRIVVQPGAVGTDATQSNKNLILSDRAEIDTRPRLEILADDVKCAHGATVGQLDEDAVYYLRTRGISEKSAMGLLTYAFANEMVERIEVGSLRGWTEHVVSHRLNVSERLSAFEPRNAVVESKPRRRSQ